MLYCIEAVRRKHGTILLSGTQAYTYLFFCDELDIAFEYHLIGDVIFVPVAFIKYNGISLTEIRQGLCSFFYLRGYFVRFRG